MTTTEMIRIIGSAATLLALVGTTPALATEVPIVVDQPVLDAPAGEPAQAAKSPGDEQPPPASASMARGAPAGEGASDDYRSDEQGEPKTKN